MNAVIFDIETVPDVELLDLALESARSRAEARRNDDPENVNVEAVKGEMALSPIFGRIVAVGTIDAEDENRLIRVGESESQIVESMWSNLAGYGLFVGFNSMSFDVPFLELRSRVLGVHIPVQISQRRYYWQNHIDLLQLLSNWRGNRTRHLKLDLATMARVLGVEPPVGASAEIPRLYESGEYGAIEDHLESDLRATFEVWKRLGSPGRGP